MATALNLYRRGATYWWRRRVPRSLTQKFHSRELRFSLRTHIRSSAVARGARLRALTDGVFEELERIDVHLDNATIDHLVAELVREELDAAERRREMAEVRGDAEAEAAVHEIHQRRARLQVDLRLRDYREVDLALRRLIKAKRLDVDLQAAESWPLQRRATRGLLSATEEDARRERGEYRGSTPLEPAPAAPGNPAGAHPVQGSRDDARCTRDPADVRDAGETRRGRTRAVREAAPLVEITRARKSNTPRTRLPGGDRLPQLFTSPVFSQPRSDFGDPLFWAPLIAVHTGCRCEQILQAKVSDFETVEGVTCFHVQAGDGQRVKTENSERRIPIHAFLVEAGLRDLLHQRRENGEIWLFPTIDRGAVDDSFKEIFTKRFRRYREQNGLYWPEHDFQSLRGDFNALLARNGVGLAARQRLMGHQVTALANDAYDRHSVADAA